MDAVVSSISLNTPVGAEICLAIGWAANGAPFESAPPGMPPKAARSHSALPGAGPAPAGSAGS